MSEELLKFSDKTERQIEIEKIIKVLRSEIKKLDQELFEFLVKLAQDSNPHKTYISHDSFEIAQESHPKYKDYQRIKIELDGKEKCLKSQAALLKERFNEFLKDGHHLISSIKDRELKQKLAKEAGRLSKSPLIPFYKLREYITPHSFVILPGYIFEETKDNRNQNACISKDEKNQFLESGEYIINCGVFGAVCVSVKAKRNQKFFHCEFLSDSVKIDNFNDEYIAIINYNDDNYRLTFQLTKIVLENTIELSLNLNKIGDSSQHYQFTICSKNTIQEQQFRGFFNPYTKS